MATRLFKNSCSRSPFSVAFPVYVAHDGNPDVVIFVKFVDSSSPCTMRSTNAMFANTTTKSLHCTIVFCSRVTRA